jgi:histidinol-phosphate aminotransferase
MDMKELIRPELITMKSYTPIEPMDILSQRAELSVEGIIKLDGNENLYGCSPKVYQALASYLYYHIYPDPEQRRLRQALEEYTGLSREHIVCGSGSDEIIDLILRLFLEPGDKVINCPPTFGMYSFSTEVCSGKVVDVPRDEDFTMDLAGIKSVLDKKTKVISVVSPNNPTGNVIAEQEIMELVNTGKVVMVDEAYFEFSNVTMANLVSNYSNLIVLRTFSKWAGLAGLRIGYGIFPTEIASYLMKIKQPYNVNVAAQAAALASLADIDYLRANIAKIVAERERLFNKLKELEWLKPYPSSANFILCSLHCGSERNEESPAKEIWHQLQKRGIFVRYFDSPQLRNCLRISVGKPEDTDALIGALKEIKSKGV